MSAKCPEWLGILCQGSSVEEVESWLEAASAAGFGQVQCAFNFGGYGQSEFEKVAGTLDKLGLRCVSFGVYNDILKKDTPAADFFGTTTRDLETAIEHVRLLGAESVVAWAGSVDDFIEPDERNQSAESRAKFTDHLEALLPTLREHKCRLLFEPWREHVIGDEKATRELCAKYPDVLGAVIDPPNFIAPKDWDQRAERVSEIMCDLIECAALIHLKDMTVDGVGGFGLPMFGEGTLTQELAKAFAPHCGKVPIIAEHLGQDGIPALLEKVNEMFPASRRSSG